MAVNLDIKLQVTENKNRQSIVVTDITGTSTNTNGWQSSDGLINPTNPKQSYVTEVKLTFTGDEVVSNEITISGADLTKFFNNSEGLTITAGTLFGTSLMLGGVYEVKAVYSGSGVIGGGEIPFIETDYLYVPLLEAVMPTIRQTAIEINIPLNATSDDLNRVLNSAVMQFLVEDIKYACIEGLKDKANDIYDQLISIINNDGKFVDNLVV